MRYQKRFRAIYVSKNRKILFNRKSKRKEKESGDENTGFNSGISKLYLEAAVLDPKFSNMDVRFFVDLPAGIDYHEWLAAHGKNLAFIKSLSLTFFKFFLQNIIAKIF